MEEKPGLVSAYGHDLPLESACCCYLSSVYAHGYNLALVVAYGRDLALVLPTAEDLALVWLPTVETWLFCFFYCNLAVVFPFSQDLEFLCSPMAETQLLCVCLLG